MSRNRETTIKRQPNIIQRAAVKCADFAGWLTIVDPSLLELYFRVQRDLHPPLLRFLQSVRLSKPGMNAVGTKGKSSAPILQHRKRASELEEIKRRIDAELHTYGHVLPKLRPLRLLLAEDEETNRRLRNVVEDIGRLVVVVGEVSDGKEVLQEAVSLKPDLVLMDVEMPSFNGLEAIREIAKNLSNTKVVVLSSKYSPDTESEAIKAGALRYLQKDNFDVVEILRILKAIWWLTIKLGLGESSLDKESATKLQNKF